MCRECCEYDQIECVCPGKKEVVGYTIPCCRNEDNECDSCLIHPGKCAGDASGRLHVVWCNELEYGRLSYSRHPSGGCGAMIIKRDTTQPVLTTGEGIREVPTPFNVQVVNL
jgi:hypothetical protein